MQLTGVPASKLAELKRLRAEVDRRERQRASKADVFGLLGFTPNPGPQTRFLALPDENLDVMYGGAAGGSKMQRVDEPVPTPRGWTTMGELRPGDEIFTETGAVCRVTEVHPVDPRPVSYRLTFDDGTQMEACADHLWLTFDARELAALTRRDPEWRARRREQRPSRATGLRSEVFTRTLAERNRAVPPPALPGPSGSVRTTKQIADTLRTPRGRANHAIPVAGALDLPEANLPLDPYALGAWLGDGTSDGAGFTTADSEILDHFRAAGISVTDVRSRTRKYAYRLGDTVMRPRANGRPGWISTFAAALRDLGVLGDKHIPVSYLRASAGQRLALLQGLMDTDGTANGRGQISFTTTSARLAGDVYELAVSLGWKVGRAERRARLNGKDCGPVWTLKWSADRPVFRLARKAERQVLATRRTTRFRYVVECGEVEPAPMRCITVDNPTHLYLAGRSMVPTHNSTSLLLYALRACIRFPGLQAFWFRRSFPELEHSVLRLLARYQYGKALGCRWRADKYELRVPGCSTLAFAHAKNVQEASAFLSAEVNLLLIDERTTLPPDVVDLLYTRVRSGVAGVPCLGIRSATNPGEIGHSRVLSDYIEPTKHGEVEFIDANKRRRIFIQARAADTPQLGEEYIRNLSGLPEKLRKAYLEGDWTVFAGQVFGEWRYDRHVIKPFTIPESWRKYNGIDGGFRAPWCVLWGAEDPDGRIWFYREIYEAGVGETEQARRITAAESPGENIAVRFADDALWAVSGEAKSSAQLYAENGVYLTPAGKGPGSRVTRVRRTRTYLAEAPACAHHRALGWVTCPLMHVFPQCENLIRTLPALPHARVGDPEDADTGAEDHAYDAMSYLLVNLGGGPQYPVIEPDQANPFDGIELLQPMGNWAVRADPQTPVWDGSGDSEPPNRTVQQNPFS